MMRQYSVKLLLLIIIPILLNGCANTVTEKESAGTEVTFSITFEGTPDFTNNSYFLVFSDTSFNLNTSLTSNYFFIPGGTYSEVSVDTISNSVGLSYFYSNYFSSWGGVIELNTSSARLTGGSFSSSTDDDSEHYSYTSETLSIPDYTVNGSTISFTVSVSELSLSTNELIFSIVISSGSDISNSNLSNVQDLIDSLQEVPLITNQAPTTGTNDASLFTGSGGSKIQSWSISVL